MTLTSADTFADFADVVRHLQLDQDSADALSVDGVMAALQSATDLIRSACGWRITQETVTGRRVWWDWRDLTAFVPTLHLTALTVTVNGSSLTDGTEYRWSENGVVWLSRLGKVSSSWFGWSPPTILATYTHGYTATDPALRGLRAVCAELAGGRVSSAANVARPLAALTVGNVTESYERAPQSAGTDSGTSRLRQDARVAPFVLPVVG